MILEKWSENWRLFSKKKYFTTSQVFVNICDRLLYPTDACLISLENNYPE